MSTSVTGTSLPRSGLPFSEDFERMRRDEGYLGSVVAAAAVLDKARFSSRSSRRIPASCDSLSIDRLWHLPSRPSTMGLAGQVGGLKTPAEKWTQLVIGAAPNFGTASTRWGRRVGRHRLSKRDRNRIATVRRAPSATWSSALKGTAVVTVPMCARMPGIHDEENVARE